MTPRQRFKLQITYTGVTPEEMLTTDTLGLSADGEGSQKA